MNENDEAGLEVVRGGGDRRAGLVRSMLAEHLANDAEWRERVRAEWMVQPCVCCGMLLKLSMN
ncbi:MAG: hypothetical protein ACRD8A_12655 [Candidatus Acidiferrales bacterium]